MSDLIQIQAVMKHIEKIQQRVWMDDLISRQDAIDAFWKLEVELRPSAIDAVLDMLEHLPSAERKGEWLELTDTNHTYVCSVCGRMLVNITNGRNTVTKNYPFCHCGADMRGEE